MRQPAWGPDRDLWVLSRVQGRVLAVTLHDGAQSDALESRCLSHRQAHSLTEQPKWGFLCLSASVKLLYKLSRGKGEEIYPLRPIPINS